VKTYTNVHVLTDDDLDKVVGCKAGDLEGTYRYHGERRYGNETTFYANPTMLLISFAWRAGLRFDDLTGSDDWSSVRDCEDPEILGQVLCRALNILEDVTT
jgi:hypothetical protein